MIRLEQYKIRMKPSRKTQCDGCGEAPATDFVGNIAGYYLAFCDACRTQFLTAPTREKQVVGFKPETVKVIQESNRKFQEYLKGESKKVRQLQRKHGRNWRRVAESML